MRARAFLAAAVLVMALPASTSGAGGFPNPGTSFVTVLPAGGLAIPLINSGDVFDGTTFEGIPDGLGIMPVGNGKKQVDVFVNFEQSHVPFSGFADHEDSSVQRARLDLATHQIVGLETMLPASVGFIRFCSANMVGPDQGFPDYTFLTNEESNDVLNVVAGQPYGADPGLTPYRQAGYSVYLDAKTGSFKKIAGAGRMNHENTVVVPGGWGGIVALTGDDTFTAPSSQLYMYSASSAGAFKQDRGSLWAFRVTAKNGTPVTATDAFNGANDYLDIGANDTVSGEFIAVPDDIARGTSGNPQTALETWSNANNVFQFVRVEDIGYDPDNPRTVYFADTGSSRIKEDSSGRLFRPADLVANKPWFNTDGRVFKMVLNSSNPKLVDSLSVLAQGRLTVSEADGTTTTVDAGVGFLNPDNVAVGHDTLMVQEDASTSPTLNDIWSYPLGGGSWTRVATVTQSAAETSGIVDASQWLGDGWWIFDIQSHSTQESFGTGTYTVPITNQVISGFTIRRELGQLSLLYIPGS
ncbi:MAG TPA: alkaline phosphatase PhoX [Methylomirabilota bacterium]|jgi:hypothetical protein|nr:alkaline phosphatase PhoX [Methylomirabilota bacterium]